MVVYRVAVLLGLSIGLFPAPAAAFLDPPYITPKNPTADDTVRVNVYGGQCDVLNTGIVPPAITHQGNKITVLFTGVHEGDPEWCYFSLATETYPIGTYSTGQYTLDVERQYFNFAGLLVQETLGIIPFTVSGPLPARTEGAPTLGIVGVYVLLLALMALATRQLRSERLETK